MIIRALVLCLLAFSGTVFAQDPAKFDWWYLGESAINQGRLFTYVDRASIKKKGKLAVADTFFFNERAFPNGERSSHSRELYDCKAKTRTLLGRGAWDEQGQFRGMQSWQDAPAEPIRPASNGDVVLRFVCGEGFVTAASISDPRVHALSILDPESASSDSTAEEESIGYGTGFFVSPDGQLVTSYHVVDGAKAIYIFTADGARHPATVFRTSALTDLAVLKVKYRPATYLNFGAANSSRPGDRVFTFGFPVMELLGAEPKFTDGAISSLSGAGGEATFAQISVPVQPGNSGGPLVNERGEVVGVIASTAAVEPFMKATGALPQNIGWAVRGEYVTPLISRPQPMPRRTREEAISLVRNSVVLIVVEEVEEAEEAEEAAVAVAPAARRRSDPDARPFRRCRRRIRQAQGQIRTPKVSAPVR